MVGPGVTLVELAGVHIKVTPVVGWCPRGTAVCDFGNDTCGAVTGNVGGHARQITAIVFRCHHRTARLSVVSDRDVNTFQFEDCPSWVLTVPRYQVYMKSMHWELSNEH